MSTRCVWKFEIELLPFTLSMPLGAEIVAVQSQHGEPHLLAIVDPSENRVVLRMFAVIGTGHAFPSDYAYVATWQEPPFVWHLFERLATPEKTT